MIRLTVVRPESLRRMRGFRMSAVGLGARARLPVVACASAIHSRPHHANEGNATTEIRAGARTMMYRHRLLAGMDAGGVRFVPRDQSRKLPIKLGQ